MQSSKLLINEPLLPIDIVLAVEYGIRTAVVASLIKRGPYGTVDYQSILSVFDRIISRTTIKRILSRLEKDGIVSRLETSPDLIKAFLTLKKRLKGRGAGIYTCLWCEVKTPVLEEHHFPISKAEGGKEIVSICANCHREYHHLLSSPVYVYE